MSSKKKKSPLSLNVEHLAAIENGPPTINIRKATGDSSKCVQQEIPNGGYGWVVVFASFMCNLTVDGICYTFGIFLPHFLGHFHSNEAITALTGSLLSGCYMTVGVFVSSLVNRYGCRPITIIGSIIAAIAFAISTLAPNVYILLLTYGVVTGCSFGLIYLPSIVSVGHYFTTKRAFATGIAVCGSGMGAFLFSPFCQFLLATYDWKQSLTILAICIGCCAFYGLLMKPLEPNHHHNHNLKRNSTCKSNQSIASAGNRRYNRSTLSIMNNKSSLSVNKSSMSVSSKYSNHSRRSFVQRPRTWTITSQLTDMEAMENRVNVRDVLDFSVLKIAPMALLAISNVFGMIGYYIPYVYIVRFATEQFDTWILSAIGISNVIGRLAFGLISDRFSGTNICFGLVRISALFINNVCLLIAGLSVMAIPFSQSYLILMAISVLFGFTISSYMSLTSIILVDILSLELLTTTFGLISCVRGLSAIAGPPLAGLLYDLTLSYTGVFLAAGSLLSIASLISFTVHRYEYFD
ncbi:hypothetical protein BLA29_001418 [Euroglyphus maynei]|uniref:Major facilitator superfamily (MFS) profile domain-containing protein n=1 Tax=Euroglyphus maynei TaxID=6958 RepID=A0A1Y3AZU4_EURMA|nr:hypothetical protein BLA29_001418 [Euroglyphus maynei]